MYVKVKGWDTNKSALNTKVGLLCQNWARVRSQAGGGVVTLSRYIFSLSKFYLTFYHKHLKKFEQYTRSSLYAKNKTLFCLSFQISIK